MSPSYVQHCFCAISFKFVSLDEGLDVELLTCFSYWFLIKFFNAIARRRFSSILLLTKVASLATDLEGLRRMSFLSMKEKRLKIDMLRFEKGPRVMHYLLLGFLETSLSPYHHCYFLCTPPSPPFLPALLYISSISFIHSFSMFSFTASSESLVAACMTSFPVIKALPVQLQLGLANPWSVSVGAVLVNLPG